MTKKNTPNQIKNHPLFSESDYQYFTDKGYTEAEIIAFWNRDLNRGITTPIEHQPAFDLVSYLNE